METLILKRDITASDLAMDSIAPGEGYHPSYVIGPCGSTVELVQDMEDGWVEVTGFANDPFAQGFVPVEAVRDGEG